MEDLQALFHKKNEAHEQLLNETIQLNTEIHKRKQSKIDTLKKKEREKFKKRLDQMLKRKKKDVPKRKDKSKTKNKPRKKSLTFFQKIKKSILFQSSDDENEKEKEDNNKKNLKQEYKLIMKKNNEDLKNDNSQPCKASKDKSGKMNMNPPIKDLKELYEPDSIGSDDELYMNYRSETMNEVSSQFSFTDGVEVKLQRMQNIEQRKHEIYEEKEFEEITINSLSTIAHPTPGDYTRAPINSYEHPITSIDPGQLNHNGGNAFQYESEVISRVKTEQQKKSGFGKSNFENSNFEKSNFEKSNFEKQKSPEMDLGGPGIDKDMLFTQISQFSIKKDD